LHTALVSTEELGRHPGWRVFDCRHDLANPALGEQQYGEAHIPGALFAHLDRDLSAPKTGHNGRHPLSEPRAFISCPATIRATSAGKRWPSGGHPLAWNFRGQGQ